MLTTAQMDEVARLLTLARDAVLVADEKVDSLRGKPGEDTFVLASSACHALARLNVIPQAQADQAISDMLSILFRAKGIDPIEANEFCATRNRLRQELEAIEQEAEAA